MLRVFKRALHTLNNKINNKEEHYFVLEQLYTGAELFKLIALYLGLLAIIIYFWIEYAGLDY